MDSNTGVQNLKCKFQFGNASIELEGVDPKDDIIRKKIAELMDAIIDSVSEIGIQSTEDSLEGDAEKDKESDDSGDVDKPEKKENRGGKRIPWVAKGVKELCKAGKITNVTPEDVMKIFKDDLAMNPDRAAVIKALSRRLGTDMVRTVDPANPAIYRYTYKPKETKEEPKAP